MLGALGDGGDGRRGTGVHALAHAVEMPRPIYPSAARRHGEQGTVGCRIHIDASGSVDEVEILLSSGSDRLDRAAIDALARWRFEPAYEDGSPVSCTVDQEVRFSLRG